MHASSALREIRVTILIFFLRKPILQTFQEVSAKADAQPMRRNVSFALARFSMQSCSRQILQQCFREGSCVFERR